MQKIDNNSVLLAGEFAVSRLMLTCGDSLLLSPLSSLFLIAC